MKKLFYSAIILTSLLVSCQENLEPVINPDPPVDTPSRTRIKSETGSSDTSTYLYDNLGRQVLYTTTTGYKKETTYDSGQVQQTSYNPQGIPTVIVTSVLNEKGLITYSESSNIPGGSTSYEYNDDNQVVKYTSITPSGTFEAVSTFVDGNKESITYLKNGVFQYTYKYTYYTDKSNGIDDEYYGESFRGHGNKNLLKNWIAISKDGLIFNSYSYTYTFDDKGRVLTLNEIHSDQTNTYTYAYY